MSDLAPVPAGAAFGHRDFRLYQVARFLLVIALEMQSVALGWHVYALTGRALSLGLIGLSQFLPVVALSMFTGHVADRFERRRVLLICYAVLAGAALALHLHARDPHATVWPIYAIAAVVGAARGFAGPAAQAMVPDLVPDAHFGNAVTWGALVHRLGTIVGPAVGGFAYALLRTPAMVYAACAVVAAIAALLLVPLAPRPVTRRAGGASWQTLLAGVGYVWRKPMILGSISLDLFAMLLGGATALLPIFARDILHVGPSGLGLLRAAPALGASLVALWLARFPLQRRAGDVMFACVALFGVSTLVFGISHSFWLSMAVLAVGGAADMISVVIRLTLVQVATPPEMRGRVSAVNMLFIGASNELGEFESGITAAWLGAAPAVIAGGIGTLIVVVAWAWLFPELRRIERVEDQRY